LWAGADIFLSLVDNIQETFGITPLEAMAAGLPVVASRAGGLPDKVIPGETGWLVDPGSPAALAEALTTALDADDASRRRYGLAGRALVERAFAWPAIAAQMEALYARLMAAAAAGGGA
jgi:glycosyltransferase involved in cell wall biosynthesis